MKIDSQFYIAERFQGDFHIVREFKSLVAGSLKKKYDIDINDIGTKLGQGSYGAAYQYGTDKVIKMTTDPSEAKTSAGLINKHTKYICKIYRVLRWPRLSSIKVSEDLPREQLKIYPTMFWIIQEYLPGRVERESGYAENLDSFLDDEATYKTIDDYIKGFINDEEMKEDFASYSEDYNIKSKDIDALIGMLQELNALGIQFYDFHIGNLMRNYSGALKLIDIGKSKSRGGAKPEDIKLERLIK